MVYCLSVMEFPSRKYGSVVLFVAASFVAVPDGPGELTWMLDRFVGDPHTRRLQAVADCCRMMSPVNGPYLDSCYDDGDVDQIVYNDACDKLGYERGFPTPILTTPIDPEQDTPEL